MEILNTVRDNWFEFFQSAFIVAGFVLAWQSSREEAKQRRIGNRWEIIKQHRDIWALGFARPELNRINDSTADLAAKPLSSEERLFVRMLILHLAGCFRAAKAEMYVLPEEMAADIRNFFSRPIPRAVWDELKGLQNKDFVLFVEGQR